MKTQFNSWHLTVQDLSLATVSMFVKYSQIYPPEGPDWTLLPSLVICRHFVTGEDILTNIMLPECFVINF